MSINLLVCVLCVLARSRNALTNSRYPRDELLYIPMTIFIGYLLTDETNI